MTLYDLCLPFQHQNRVHWSQKWLETCVTLIYHLDVIYLPTDLPKWRPSCISVSTAFCTGGDGRKVILGKTSERNQNVRLSSNKWIP